MADKKKIDKQASPIDMPCPDTSSNAQRIHLPGQLHQLESEAICRPSRVHLLLMLVAGLEVLQWVL